jgi:hypothetical protein
MSDREPRASGGHGPARPVRKHLVLLFVVVLAALCLHGDENVFKSDIGFSPGLFLWAMMPYGICLAGLAVMTDALPLATAAAAALGLDALAFDAVFIHPTSSTAPLALIFIPLWNALLVVPVTALVTYLLLRWRSRR